jgi:hypothetical protein
MLLNVLMDLGPQMASGLNVLLGLGIASGTIFVIRMLARGWRDTVNDEDIDEAAADLRSKGYDSLADEVEKHK